MSLQNGLSPRGGPHWQCTWIPESYGQACEWQSYNGELRKTEMSTKWLGAQGGPTVWTFDLCSQRSPGLHVLRFEPMDDLYTPSPPYSVSSLGFIQTIKLLFFACLVKTCYSFISQEYVLAGYPKRMLGKNVAFTAIVPNLGIGGGGKVKETCGFLFE